MATREVRISSVMSLDDKVCVIRAYDKMVSTQQRNKFRSSHKQIEKIIMNRNKILKQHSVTHTKVVSDFVKIGLLEQVVLEWFQRFRSLFGLRNIKFEFFQERVTMARDILNMKSVTLSAPWVNALRLSCVKAPPRDVHKDVSLSMKEIVNYVLQKKFISKVKAESAYGIHVFDDELTRAAFSDQKNLLNEVRKDEKPSNIFNSEELEFIEVDENEDEFLEESTEGGKVTGSDATTIAKDCLEDIHIIEDSNDSSECSEHTNGDPATMEDNKDFLVYLVHNVNEATSIKISPESSNLMEDNKDTLKHLIHGDDALTPSKDNMDGNHLRIEGNQDASLYLGSPESSDLMEDNKDTLKHLIHGDEASTPSKDNMDGNHLCIKNNQDALLYLKPLGEYLLSQGDIRGLELLIKMKTTLVKSE